MAKRQAIPKFEDFIALRSSMMIDDDFLVDVEREEKNARITHEQVKIALEVQRSANHFKDLSISKIEDALDVFSRCSGGEWLEWNKEGGNAVVLPVEDEFVKTVVAALHGMKSLLLSPVLTDEISAALFSLNKILKDFVFTLKRFQKFTVVAAGTIAALLGALTTVMNQIEALIHAFKVGLNY